MGDSNVEAFPVESTQVNEPTTTSATPKVTSHISRREVQIKEKSALSKAESTRSRSENPGRIVSATPSKRSQSATQKEPTEDAEVQWKNEWNIDLDDRDSDSSESSSDARAVSVISDQPRRRQRRYNDIEVVVDIPPIKFPRQKRRINQHIHEHFHKGRGKKKGRRHRRRKDRDERENEKDLKEESVTIIDNDDNNLLRFKNDWIDGKCCVICFTFTECFAACYCCPCYVCKLFHRAREPFLTILLPFSCCILRTNIRARFKIKGGIFSDYLSMCSCPAAICVCVQMMTELQQRDFGNRKWDRWDELDQATANAMKFKNARKAK